MTVLGIDTAGMSCSAAVTQSGRILASREVVGQQLHSERLLGLIAESLDEANLDRTKIDGIAVSIGPGSFTGLRIGMSVAKGLAFALERPLVGIPTLAVLAGQAAMSGVAKEGAAVMAIVDAHRDGVCAALYRNHTDGMREISSFGPVTLEECARRVQEHVVVVGSGAERFKSFLTTNSGGTEKLCSFPDEGMTTIGAGVVGLLGEKEFAASRQGDTESLEPLYVGDAFRRGPAVAVPQGGER